MTVRFLGKYESLGLLGMGSMGQVHAARPADDPATTVVVKTLRADRPNSPRARQLFAREAAHAARLRHPYIVRVLDAGVDDEAGPCVVLEFVPGTPPSSSCSRRTDGSGSTGPPGWPGACVTPWRRLTPPGSSTAT